MIRIFKKFKMNLYHLDINDLITYSSRKPEEVAIKMIDAENLEQIRQQRPDKYKRWKLYIEKNNGHGCIALNDGKIVGYGWLKEKGVSDSFYKIRGGAYLSEFFVDPSERGKNIYPAMISFLIENNRLYSNYYISAYTTNIASNKGILKVGFKTKSTLTFFRILKLTLNKHTLI